MVIKTLTPCLWVRIDAALVPSQVALIFDADVFLGHALGGIERDHSEGGGDGGFCVERVDDVNFCGHPSGELVDFCSELYGEEFGCELETFRGRGSEED